MLRTDFGKFKYLGLLAVLCVTFQLVSNVTGARLVSLFGASVSVSVYTFPMVFLISDILTEVYGYSQSRNVIWLAMFCRVLMGVAIWLLLLIPSAPIFTDDVAYQRVLSSGLRVALAGVVAGFAGDICNSYCVAKMKVWNKGHHMWARFVASPFVGEGIDTLLFYSLAFYGVIAVKALLPGMLMAWLAKTLWEIVALPVTYPIVRWLKKIESIDYYDRKTNFNPFITDAS